MTEHQFLKIVTWTNQDLWEYCRKMTEMYGHIAAVEILLRFRREIQQAVAKFSKKKHMMDGIQHRAIWICEMIHKWCGTYYKRWAKYELIKSKPELATNPQKLKGLTNNAWEIYARRLSY